MVQLRSYQETLLRLVQDALAADPKARVMMQLPTGGGKTVIAGALLTERFKSGRKAVWLTHRKELAAQTRRMLTELVDLHDPEDGRTTGTKIFAICETNWLRPVYY